MNENELLSRRAYTSTPQELPSERREKIDADVAEYLAKGNTIETLPIEERKARIPYRRYVQSPNAQHMGNLGKR